MAQVPNVLYLPHGGGPLPLLGDPGHAGLTRFLAGLAPGLGGFRAVLVISAHWEADRPTVTSGPAPALIYDYYGFPPESYEIRYPAPGDPALVQRVLALLEASGIAARADAERGFDHGLFVPLKLMLPEARTPCVQLSLTGDLDPARHLAVGRARAPLRDEGVLVVGSGLSFHNLRAFFAPPSAQGHAASVEFDSWLRETCCGAGLDAATRRKRLLGWSSAPHARHCHPREEHLLPLHVCAGISGDAPGAVIFNDDLMGQRVSGFAW